MKGQTLAAMAAARGARYLDRTMPGWWRRVDPTDLDLGCPCNCVLGQLEGDFYEAVYLRRLSKARAEHLGLTAPRPMRWSSLTNAWLAIVRRRSLDKAADL